MNRIYSQKIFFHAVTFFSFLIILNCSCHNDSKRIQGIEGLWESPSNQAVWGTWKMVYHFEINNNKELESEGYFVVDNEYRDKFNLAEVRFDEVQRTISFVDEAGDRFKGYVRNNEQRIIGAFHLKNGEVDSVNLSRCRKQIEMTLLHTRLPDKNGKLSYKYSVPENIGDGLTTASLIDVGIDTSLIFQSINDVIHKKHGRIHSLLIIKNGKLVCEEYFYGDSPQHLHKIQSCTKSITSLLIGIAIDKGTIIDINQPLFFYFPQYDSLKTPEKKKIKLEDILKMTSGFEWNEYPKEMYYTNDWFQYILSRPIISKPGTQFNYNSGCSILLAGIIKNVEGIYANYFAEKFLFSPLGITEYKWQTHQNGMPQTGGGLSLRPRDMAKIGLLVLNEGAWRGNQIISQKWIQESTKYRQKVHDIFSYGYHWWQIKFETEEQNYNAILDLMFKWCIERILLNYRGISKI